VTFAPLTANMPTTTMQVDSYGHFTATVVAGATYGVNGSMYGSPMGAYTYDVATASSMAFNGGEVLDLAIPTSKVTLQVRNLDGQPVSGASISTSSSTMNTGALIVEADEGGVSGTTTDTGTVVTPPSESSRRRPRRRHQSHPGRVGLPAGQAFSTA
jgi:hypothetical protein